MVCACALARVLRAETHPLLYPGGERQPASVVAVFRG